MRSRDADCARVYPSAVLIRFVVAFGLLLTTAAAILAAPAHADTPAPRPRAPTWLAPAYPDTHVTPYVTTRVIAVGDHTAIAVVELWSPARGGHAARPLMHLAYDPATGVRGPLILPAGTTWLGLGSGDVILAATGDGALLAADTVDRAVAGGFVARGRVAAATRWDANSAAGLVVAAGGGAVWISSDGGATFERHARPRAVTAVFVRGDGVLVAEVTGGGPEVSRDRGATWAPAPREVGTLVLERNGNFIGARDDGGKHACHSGVLAADGASWVPWQLWRTEPKRPGVKWPAVTQLGGLTDRWNERLLDYAEQDAGAPVPRANAATDPMPVSAPGALAAYHASCKADDGSVFGMGMLSGSMATGPGCHGADCISSTMSLPSHTRQVSAKHLHDGACRVAPASTGEPAACDEDKPPLRSPHGVIVDLPTGRSSLLTPPSGCSQVLFEDLGGAALIACQAGEASEVYLAGLDGVWSSIGKIADVPTAAQRAADGTILVTRRCTATGRRCVAWLRRPAALGEREALLEPVDVPGARAFGAVVGGKALVAAVRPAAADDRSWIFLDQHPELGGPPPADRPKALTDQFAPLADCFQALGAGRQPGEVALHWDASGTVIDRGPPELVACVRKFVGALPRSIPSAHNVIYFRVRKQAIDLLETRPGEPATAVARDVQFEGELSNVALTDRGEITLNSYDETNSTKRFVYRIDRATGKAMRLLPR